MAEQGLQGYEGLLEARGMLARPVHKGRDSQEPLAAQEKRDSLAAMGPQEKLVQQDRLEALGTLGPLENKVSPGQQELAKQVRRDRRGLRVLLEMELRAPQEVQDRLEKQARQAQESDLRGRKARRASEGLRAPESGLRDQLDRKEIRGLKGCL